MPETTVQGRPESERDRTVLGVHGGAHEGFAFGRDWLPCCLEAKRKIEAGERDPFAQIFAGGADHPSLVSPPHALNYLLCCTYISVW